MMKKRLLFFLMTLFCLSFLKAQTVQTTNGTLTQGYIPMYVLYEYSYTQHIVLKSELENGGWNNTFDSITKLRWHWDGIGNFNTANTWEIYLGNTSKTAFSSTTDWVALADLTEVFNGEVTFPTSAGWIEVELDQPFAYDGVNNLVIAVNETVPGWGTPSPKFISTNVGESRGLYKHQDSSPFYPATPPIGVVTAVLPNLQVYFQESCPSPNNVHLTSVTSTTATIGWNLGDEETGWNLEYREVGDADWTLVSGLTSMTYQITNLTPNTQYQVRLQSDCVTEQSNFTAPIAFYTSLIPVQLPYFNDFENAATYSDFQLLNGTQTNQWVISGAPNVNNTDNGSYAMYISNDPTTDAWAYSAGATVSPSRVYAFCDVEVPAGVAELKLTFDWIANGASATNDFLRVYWMPVNVEVVPGQNPPTVGGVNYDWEAQIGNHTNGIGEHWLSQQTTWQQAEFVINTTQFPNLAGNTWRLYFHWRNGTAIAAQPPATVDNISIEVVECPTPSQLTISNTTATTVDLAWTENGDATSWFVEYKKSTEDTWASEMATSNPYTVQNLESSTTYQFRVQSNCGTELSPYTSVVSTTTLCAPVTVLPWDDSFESISYAGTLPLCWAATNFGSVVYTQTSNDSYNRIARTGTRAAYFRWNCNDHIFTPAFELQANVSYDFSFWYVTDGWSGWQSLKANVYSAQTPDSLILQLAEVTNVTNMTYQKLKGTFTPTEDGIYYFGTFCQATGDPYYLTVDDFVVSETPSCVEPTDLTVTNITTTGAEINFVPVGTDYLDFKVMWRVEGEQTWEEITLNGVTTYQLTNLTPNTLYQIRVATDCLDGSYSDFVGTSFRTACADIVTFPYTENFDNHGTGEGSFPTCWSYLTNYTNPPTCSSTYSVSSPNSLYAYSYNNRYTILIAPKVDDSIDLSDLQVSFYARGAENQYVHLGVIEDPTSPSSFVTIQSFPVSSFLAQYTGYLANYTGTSKYVAIKVAPTTYVSYYFDDFVLDYAPDCPPVSNIAVSNVGATSALVSWSPNGTPDSYNVEVILAGDATGTQYTTSNNHYILTGLNEVTDYTVSVSPSCSGVAGPAVSTTFTTNCALGGDVIVGTPEATTNTSGQCLPCHTYYNYSYSQQIFDAAEVSDIADTVHGIAFQYFYGTNITRNIEIYLGHTDQATYTATSDYVPGGAFVKVYDGSVEFTNTGENNWHSINFTTPFVYDADSNLVITVIDKTGSYVNGVSKFRTHATNETKAIAFYQDTGSPYTLIPSGGNSAMYGNRNNVKFITPCQVATCYPPNLIAEYVGSYSVDYQILPVASENSWEVEYKLSEETNWTSVGVVNTTTNSLTNLAPYTQYDLRVRSLCGTSDMSIWKEVSFTTLAAIPATIPYSCDFENPVENAEWSFKNSGQTNQWYIGNASNNPDVNNTVGGANALYISNDGGDTWAYTAGADNYSKSYAFRDFVIPATATELRLTIDWIANGAGANDMLRLFWVLPDANINAGAIPAGTVNVDAALATSYGTYVDNISLQGVTDWQESSTFTINNTQFPNFAGKTWRLYFMWRNDVTTGDQQPPAVVDNITLEAVTCPTPFQLAATTATQNSVTLSWTETGYATTWNVEYKKASESTWSVVQAYGTPFEVQNLDHSTNYMFRVQSDCGNGEVSGYSSIITEQTLCAPVVTLPWDDSFESITAADEFPTCWLPTGVIGKLKTQIVDYGMMNRNARTGTKCAYFVYSANNTLYTPAFELQAGVSYDFSFWYVTCGNEGWTTLQSAVYSSQS
ncbi:MAG TPA: fibronectin type III domain-containing protein, partial [Bacteroidales bacterium]|nr:fibronectin type III domain-containing protein [Bacteroidales bacterium]